MSNIVASAASSGMSNGARMLQALRRATGIVSNSALAELAGVPLRTIQRWAFEIVEAAVEAEEGANVGAPNAPPVACTETPNAPNAPRVAPQDAPNAPTLARPSRIYARARFESPSEIVIEKDSAASSAHAQSDPDEIPGLNGSTDRLARQLAGWLSPFMPDVVAARSILLGNVEAYGAEQVRAGMVELETVMAAGEKPRNLAKTFSAFMKNADASGKERPTRAAAPAADWKQAEIDRQRAFREMLEQHAAGGVAS